MKISVLTPTYNDGISIKETMESLIAQTYSDWEWIIVNDGSTDDTEERVLKLIEEYGIKDKTTYLYQENGDQLNALLNGANHIKGDYVFILHSDDLLPSDTFFEDCLKEMAGDEACDGLFGDLIIVNEKSEVTGKQIVKPYHMDDRMAPLMLLWLGRNIFSDVAFHKKEVFVSQIKENYLTWNMPLWLYYDKKPQMINYKTAQFPVLKYRIHEGNYINSELGLHNVLNGELRTAIRLMHYYTIPNYKYQYLLYRVFNKLGKEASFKVSYKASETKDKAAMIDFIIQKRFPEYQDKIYFYSIQQFYQNKKERVLDMSNFAANLKIYAGKDARLFNKKLLNNELDESYIWFMKEMTEGFNKVINYEHLGKEKMEMILRFFCIEKEVEV